MPRRLFACVLVLAASPALADDTYSPGYAACMERSGGVTAAMVDCIATEHEAQDQRLNTNYRALVAELAPARRQQLATAQRLWVRYRDANCAYYADPEGGTLARVAGNECVLRETAQRADELAAFATPMDR